jgi:hypothetical protein
MNLSGPVHNRPHQVMSDEYPVQFLNDALRFVGAQRIELADSVEEKRRDRDAELGRREQWQRIEKATRKNSNGKRCG